MLTRLLGEDVTVTLALAPDLAPILADRGQLEQIIMNLAVNARDAMPAGGAVTIETALADLEEDYAKTHLSAKPGSYVTLSVTDTGTGLSPEARAHLFEPFFTTKELGKGTGLGLATVYGIVTQYDGYVGVYSEAGKGTSFNLYFPKAHGTASPVPAVQPPRRILTGSETILVVEDMSGLRALTERMLERLGYTVLLAANGDDALRWFEQGTPIDLVLTDVVMPGLSGPQLAGKVAAIRPGLKVLYMSGYTDETIVRHGILEPGIAFLHKPFNSDALGKKIREVLES
jgi:CheY-like chemotaxis protein